MISVLTVAFGRQQALKNLWRGMLLGDEHPAEHIVVTSDLHLQTPADLPFPVKVVPFVSHQTPLPIAAARNIAAERAKSAKILFLDVDCIPSSSLVRRSREALEEQDGIAMGSVKYLPQGAVCGEWNEWRLHGVAETHRLQPPVEPGDPPEMIEKDHFWSLNFAMHWDDFICSGGFDENYKGYGAEDTDFAFKCEELGIPLYRHSGLAYHQWHPSCFPPVDKLDEIVINANRFSRKWDMLPMMSWLERFAELGFVRINYRDKQVHIAKKPNALDVRAAGRTAAT